jgi:excisionase family DNA binding protein
MSSQFHTVEEAAQRLRLHPKTVLRYVGDGRLRATRVGKSYRILRSDLDAFAGAPAPAQPSAARATCIVDAADIDAERAQRLAVHLTAARANAQTQPEPMSLDVAYDPARRSVKVVLVGSPADTAAMLKLVQVLLEA